jgi:hypothetical protein
VGIDDDGVEAHRAKDARRLSAVFQDQAVVPLGLESERDQLGEKGLFVSRTAKFTSTTFRG